MKESKTFFLIVILILLAIIGFLLYIVIKSNINIKNIFSSKNEYQSIVGIYQAQFEGDWNGKTTDIFITLTLNEDSTCKYNYNGTEYSYCEWIQKDSEVIEITLGYNNRANVDKYETTILKNNKLMLNNRIFEKLK